MSGTNVWVSAWFPHPFQPNELVQAYGKEERQDATEVVSPPPGSTPGVTSGDTKNDDNVATTVTISSTTTAQCIGLDWESSSNEEGPYQPAQPNGQGQSIPCVPHNHLQPAGSQPAMQCRHHHWTAVPRLRLHQFVFRPVSSRTRRLRLTTVWQGSEQWTAQCDSALTTSSLATENTTVTGLTPGALNSPPRRTGKIRSRHTCTLGTSQSLPAPCLFSAPLRNPRSVLVGTTVAAQTGYKSSRGSWVQREVLTRAPCQLT